VSVDLVARAGAAAADLQPDQILDLIWYLLWISHFRRWQHADELLEVVDRPTPVVLPWDRG
jgi:hypothetical protein